MARWLKDDMEAKAAQLPEHPRIYRIGRVVGTREMVVRSNYIVIYTQHTLVVTVLRVLHAAQQWPPAM
ncbi:MAG: type II toxin-antitoxin system RelE/ParE family toxin [Rhodanobacteraceae bacterium]